MTERFNDDGYGLSQFADVILVECPKCSQCAQIIGTKLTCSHCALSKEVSRDWNFSARANESNNKVPADGVDPFLNLPLWLKAPYKNEILWFYNKKHLEIVESYVEAKLRERSVADNGDSREGNSRLFSRLPQWIKSAKNRDDILHLIKKLKQKL
jgi:hypothetical protein